MQCAGSDAVNHCIHWQGQKLKFVSIFRAGRVHSFGITRILNCLYLVQGHKLMLYLYCIHLGEWGVGIWNFFTQAISSVSLCQTGTRPPCFQSTLPLQAKTTTASSIAVPAREVVGEIWQLCMQSCNLWQSCKTRTWMLVLWTWSWIWKQKPRFGHLDYEFLCSRFQIPYAVWWAAWQPEQSYWHHATEKKAMPNKSLKCHPFPDLKVEAQFRLTAPSTENQHLTQASHWSCPRQYQTKLKLTQIKTMTTTSSQWKWFSCHYRPHRAWKSHPGNGILQSSSHILLRQCKRRP